MKLLPNIPMMPTPHNPNGSDFNTAMMCDKSGRHLVTMPHIERSTYQWNWANYIENRKDEVSPWIEAFVNARRWLNKKNKIILFISVFSQKKNKFYCLYSFFYLDLQ